MRSTSARIRYLSFLGLISLPQVALCWIPCQSAALQSTSALSLAVSVSDEALVSDTYKLNLRLAEMAKQCAKNGSNTLASKALKLLRACPEPDTVAYNSVLKAVAKVRRIDGKPAAIVAENLLQEMKQIHEQQYREKEEWYRKLGNGELNQTEISNGAPVVKVKPNCRSYSTVLDAFSKDRTSIDRVESLLAELEEEYESTGDVALMPNLITYNTALSAFARTGDRLEDCLDLFEAMPMEPDVISYNNVLHALARAGKGDDAARMIKRMIDSGLIPNARSYTTLLDAYGQAGQPDKAYELLLEMEEKAKKDASLQPNTISYSTVIHAYAVSKQKDKADRAYELVQRMIQKGIPPNQVTMNSLLNACASSIPDSKVIDRMKYAYGLILRDYEADQFTFGTILKGYSNARWHDDEFCKDVFREACRRGSVSSGVLHQLRQAVPVDVYRELVGDDRVRWIDLPKEWTRNIREDRSKRRR